MRGRLVTSEPFKVIEGAWVAAPELVNLPQHIRARSPEDRNKPCRVRVYREDVRKAAAQRRRQPAYEFWSVLSGKAPPVPHRLENADEGLCTLFDAHACFRGVRRPIGEDGAGDTFVAYILKPKLFCVYDARPPLVMTHKVPAPDDLVFVAYVRMDEPSDATSTKGVLTHWHFVEADPRDARLPIGYDERYVDRLW